MKLIMENWRGYLQEGEEQLSNFVPELVSLGGEKFQVFLEDYRLAYREAKSALKKISFMSMPHISWQRRGHSL